MKSLSKNEGLIVVGLLAVLVFYSPISKVSGYWSMDKNGNMVQYKKSSSQVLGEEDNKKEEEEKKQTENKKEEEKKTEEKKNEKSDKSNDTSETNGKEDKVKETKAITEIKQEHIESVEIHKSEPENEDEDEDEDEDTIDKDEIEASDEGDIEVDIKKVDKKELKEKQESFEMETENGDKVHIELSPEKTQFEIKKNGVSASIELPLSVDPLLKKLVIATADGNKTLESLPDEVINKLITEKKLGTGSKVQINLQIENGQIVYHIEEVKRKKIAGVIPIDLTKNLSVSDSTGNVLSEQESFLTKVLSFISI